jgi:hypothetical protein
MSIGVRTVGIWIVFAVVGALLLGWRHQRTSGAAPNVQAESGLEGGI